MPSIILSEEFLAKAKAAKSFEELKALVSAEGVEVADSELMGAWERISESAGKGKFKLSAEELDDVAGGCLDGTAFGGGVDLERSDVNGLKTVRSDEVRPCGWDGDTTCGNCTWFEPCNTGFKDHDGLCTRTGW